MVIPYPVWQLDITGIEKDIWPPTPLMHPRFTAPQNDVGNAAAFTAPDKSSRLWKREWKTVVGK